MQGEDIDALRKARRTEGAANGLGSDSDDDDDDLGDEARFNRLVAIAPKPNRFIFTVEVCSWLLLWFLSWFIVSIAGATDHRLPVSGDPLPPCDVSHAGRRQRA